MKPLTRIFSICAASMLLLAAGCTSTTGSTGPEPALTLYVAQVGGSTGNSVLEFPANGSGSITPSNTVTMPAQTVPGALAVDTSGNLYVSASKGAAPSIVYEVLVYALAATGAATPTNTITSSSFTAAISSIAVDSTGEVYALSGNSISVFAPGAAANAAPVRQITGSLTQLNSASAIAVDAAQNIYVANTAAGNILVFSSIESGNIAPVSILAGTLTSLGSPTGLAIDSSGDIYVATFNLPSNSSQLLEFSPGATGNVAPVNMLTAVASVAVAGVAVDVLDNMYVATAASGQFAVDVFSAGESAGSAPTGTISSTAWTAAGYGQIAVR